MDIKEKVAYVKGLADGLGLDKNDTNGKLIAAIIDILDDMADEIDAMTENEEYLENYIEELDEDLGSVEDHVFCSDEDDDYDSEDYLDGDFDDEDDDDDDDGDDEIVVVTCPSCGDGVYLDDTMDFDEIKCPSCGTKFSCTYEDSEHCEGCGE